MTKNSKPPLKHTIACKAVELTRFLSFRSAWKLSSIFTALFFRLDSGVKRTIENNIKKVYPQKTPEQQDQLIYETFRHTVAFALEAGAVWLRPLQYGTAHITKINGLELLEQAQASGKGVLILLPHLGNWEMANQFIAPRAKVVALFKPHQNKLLNQHIYNARTRAGVEMVPTDGQGVRQILRHLKQGGVSVILPDQVPETSGGINVPFFGQDALTPTLASKLAKSSGANLIGLVCARTGTGEFEIHLSKAPATIANADSKVAATSMNAYIESLVNEFPSQYQWSYKRFKSIQKST